MLAPKTKQILIIIAAVTLAILLIGSFAVYAYLITKDPKVAQTFAITIGQALGLTFLGVCFFMIVYPVYVHFNR